MRASLLALLLLCFSSLLSAERITIAAASDLRFALDEVIVEYKRLHTEAQIEVIYGSSGKMTTQIIHGAPYDLFFSADIAFTQRLKAAGLAASEPEVYALGRIVLWSASTDASRLTLADLTNQKFKRIAIAQPTHAPYGMRAKEAMLAAGVWQQVQSKLVFAENIAQAAQMAQSGAADIAVIALSLVKFPDFKSQGYSLIPAELHKPLTQGYVVTQRGKDKKEVLDFARFMATDSAHLIMKKYGFTVPDSQ
ncbi:Molybdate-binding protein ModA [Rheinheimera sp. MM224]|nr:Molybdate-binding protein ModA [Rheinheimera sp. MM224]